MATRVYFWENGWSDRDAVWDGRSATVYSRGPDFPGEWTNFWEKWASPLLRIGRMWHRPCKNGWNGQRNESCISLESTLAPASKYSWTIVHDGYKWVCCQGEGALPKLCWDFFVACTFKIVWHCLIAGEFSVEVSWCQEGWCDWLLCWVVIINE